MDTVTLRNKPEVENLNNAQSISFPEYRYERFAG